MGRHSAPSRGRGEQARGERAGRVSRPQPQQPGARPGPEHAHAHEAVRGHGHPQHEETVPRARPRAPYGGHPAAMPERDVESTWETRHAVLRRPGPGQGPRREYLAAFDDPPETAVPTAPSDEDTGPDADEPEDAGGERKPRGRTLTGVGAAAVMTVLAVVVAGHFVGGGQRGDASAAAGDVDRKDAAASRSHQRATPSKAPAGRAPAAPASMHDQLRGRFPLKDDLGLGGKFTTIGGSDRALGKGQVLRYRVDVEKGLPLDGELFARFVHETLNDSRSWGHNLDRTFERVSSGRADFVVTLASPKTTDTWCAKSGLDTSVDHVSCDSASTERVMINAYRWAQGASTYGDQMLTYRQMLINHEVGHRLGHGHEGCPKDGALAPVMMQQTKYLTTDGATCKPNPWPFP